MSNQGSDHAIELQPPENFAMVQSGIYRSAFPRTKNLTHIKSLNLKTVLPLVPEEYPEALAEFYKANGIKLLSHGLDGNKWPFKELNEDDVSNILKDVFNINNQPLLIHCNKGKHRTGSVVGCIRKVQGWALTAILNEYYMYACPKARLEDQRFIELFDEVKFIKENSALLSSYNGYITGTVTDNHILTDSLSQAHVDPITVDP